MVRTSLIRWVKHLADQFFVTDSINFRSYFLTSVCFSYSMPLWHGIRGKLHKAQVQGCLWTVRGRWTKCETDVWFINYWGNLVLLGETGYIPLWEQLSFLGNLAKFIKRSKREPKLPSYTPLCSVSSSVIPTDRLHSDDQNTLAVCFLGFYIKGLNKIL